jgi:cell division protein ZapA
MATEPTPVLVTILGKEFRVACPTDEKDSLLDSARHLDLKMREIRDRGRTQGADNIAIMAALNITHELLKVQGQKDKFDISFSNRVRQMQQKIDTALSAARQIEL